jgi:AraC-like DNA-binding protein
MEKQIKPIAALQSLMAEILPKEERRETAVPGLILSRIDAPTDWHDCFYTTQAVLMVQGGKEVVLGREETSYRAGQCLVSSVDLPAKVRIVDTPCVAVVLRIDGKDIEALVDRTRAGTTGQVTQTSIKKGENAEVITGQTVAEADSGMVEAFTRLVRLAESPSPDAVIGQITKDEILYRLLTGPWGGKLRSFYQAGTSNEQLARAIGYMKEHYNEPCSVPRLATLANMAESTFYRRFLALTGISPLQYQKRLRLCEAQRLLLTGVQNASGAGYSVGYESASQFTRDYRRLFGAPPRNDMRRRAARP